MLLDDSGNDGVWSGSTILDAAGGHFTILNRGVRIGLVRDISGQSCADVEIILKIIC